MLKRPLLYWRTLKYLRWRQLSSQLLFRLIPQRVPNTPDVSRRVWATPWRGHTWRQPQLTSASSISLLNVERSIADSACWNDSTIPKLWLYELHYFHDLDAINAHTRRDWHRTLIERWVRENPPGTGNGWEPFPVSMRIVSWVKSFSQTDDVPLGWLDSLALQAQWLFERPEYHLLANHLFVNAKALVFAGAFFDGPDADLWLQKGLGLLEQELDEQFLADGGHFERSPMYHAALLWDLLELYELGLVSGLDSFASLSSNLIAKIVRACDWLRMITHPDGGIAFFNDACLNKEPTLACVEAYVKLLRVTLGTDLEPVSQSQQGFVRSSHGSAVILLDCGGIGAPYQPGHAHAGTLSFELSIDNHRVLVNSGTSTYAVGDLRSWQRSTAAHNTVTIDGENSSEVWAGFRVARRVRVWEPEIHSMDGGSYVRCVAQGYRSSAPKHCRQWDFTRNELTVHDQIEGKFGTATAHFYCHPEVQATQTDANTGKIAIPGGRTVRWRVVNGTTQLERSEYYPEFNVTRTNQRITVSTHGSEMTTKFDWT